MAVHFNWTQLIPGVEYDMVHVATYAGACTLLIALGLVARVGLGSGEMAIIPASKLTLRGIFELLTDFVVGLSDSVVGDHGRSFVPFFSAVFLLVFFNNILGLLPGMTPATDNLNTTVALGIVSFVYYNYHGVKENGWGYLSHFLGPFLPIAPFMIVVELISHAIRPLSLGLRLQANLMGDHMVLGVFLDLAPYVIPVVFYMVGLFVSFMQAFVFMMMTMIYVSLAISHDH